MAWCSCAAARATATTKRQVEEQLERGGGAVLLVRITTSHGLHGRERVGHRTKVVPAAV